MVCLETGDTPVISVTVRYVEMYDITNIVGYALGVPSSFMEHKVRDSAVVSFTTLKQDEDLCILRSLSSLRTKIMSMGERLRPYLGTNTALYTFIHLPSYIRPTLEHAGFSCFFATDDTVYQRVLHLNQAIVARLNCLDKYLSCGEEYAATIKQMFVFPKIESEEQYLAYCSNFASYKSSYPSRCWYNTKSPKFRILMNDHTLISTLADEYGMPPVADSDFRVSRVQEHNLGSRALKQAQNNSLEYLKGIMCDETASITAIIDAQNLQPEETYCFIDWMYEEYTPAISKFILLQDGTERWQWGKAEAVLPGKVERVTSNRIVRQKSTVDTNLLCRVMREFYEGSTDTFLIFSGDCDFLPLVDNLPEARFCFFGLSGCVSGQSLRYASDHNAKFIIMDEHLRSIKYSGGRSLKIVDNITARLNEKNLSAIDLITSVVEASSYLGQKIDNAVAQLLLNEILTTYKIKVTADGTLRFDYQDTKQNGGSKNGTHDAYWNSGKAPGC